MVKKILLRIFYILLAISSIVLVYAFWPVPTPDLDYLKDSGNPYEVTIYRDTWGVPHIFGVTDADASHGLAYAHAEDDFFTIQQALLAAKGMLATVYGMDSAPVDYSVHLLRIWDVVEEKYESGLTLETRTLLEAYAAGLNLYAAHHPDEVLLEDAFPITGQDLVAASIQRSPLFFGLDDTIGELFNDERAQPVSPIPGAYNQLAETRFGSNVFAVGPSRTPDGSTYLAVNAHQPWTGPVAWYEAHIHSEEGLDMVGAVFPGAPVIIQGHNRNLGWSFTVSKPDLTDVFVLEINPDNSEQYLLDGEWLDLEVRSVPIKVKLLGRIAVTVNQKVYWSEFGPVIIRDHGTYALRYSGFGRVDIFEQLYRMNKAATFDEWQSAMHSGALPTFNVGYADKEGNLYYLYNASLPIRVEGYDWSVYLPGSNSELIWSQTEYFPHEELPQVLNPPSGFIQNANSSPFQTTFGDGNPIESDFPEYFGIETYLSNRAMRLLEIFEEDDSITFEEFEAYKNDMTYSQESDVYKIVEIILNAQYEKPEFQTGQEILSNWDYSTSKDSIGASLLEMTLYFINENSEDFSYSILGKNELPPRIIHNSYMQGINFLLENYGDISVPWGEVNRLVRGEVNLSLDGGPDTLRAIYGDLQEDGRIHANAGDSYVMLVRWFPDGKIESFSVHQFGAATLDETSVHYSDQSELFSKNTLKPIWFDLADILNNVEEQYNPGQEIH